MSNNNPKSILNSEAVLKEKLQEKLLRRQGLSDSELPAQQRKFGQQESFGRQVFWLCLLELSKIRVPGGQIRVKTDEGTRHR